MTNIIFSAIISYLLGSIPFGFIIGKIYGIDIREKGSKNIGATNVFRVLGKKPGIFTFLLDATKGVAAVCVVPQCVAICFGNNMISATSILISAVAVFIGHTYTLFLGFKGGKGVATGLGLAIGLAPISAVCALVIWIIVFAISRYVSVSSIVAATTLGIVSWFFDNSGATGYVTPALISVLAVFVIYKHRSNIERLIAGNEHRFSFK